MRKAVDLSYGTKTNAAYHQLLCTFNFKKDERP